MQPEATPNLPAVPPANVPAVPPPKRLPDNPFDPEFRPVYFTNLNPQVPADQNLILKCIDEPSLKKADYVNRELPVKWVYAHVADGQVGDDGELGEWVRLVLVTPEGDTLSMSGAIAGKALFVAKSLYGPGPWDPPLLCTIKQKPTRDNKTCNLLGIRREDSPAAVT